MCKRKAEKVQLDTSKLPYCGIHLEATVNPFPKIWIIHVVIRDHYDAVIVNV